MLVGGEALDAPRVGQRLPFSDADARLVGVKVISLQKLHRVRGHHWQLQPRGQGHGGAHMGFMRRQAGALQLDVEAAGEQG